METIRLTNIPKIIEEAVVHIMVSISKYTISLAGQWLNVISRWKFRACVDVWVYYVLTMYEHVSFGKTVLPLRGSSKWMISL